MKKFLLYRSILCSTMRGPSLTWPSTHRKYVFLLLFCWPTFLPRKNVILVQGKSVVKDFERERFLTHADMWELFWNSLQGFFSYLIASRVTFTLALRWKSSAYHWLTAVDMEILAGSAFSPETHTVDGTWPKSGAWLFRQTTISLLGMVIVSPCLRKYQTFHKTVFICLVNVILFFHTVDSYRVLTNLMPQFVGTLQVSNRKMTRHDLA